MTSDPSRQELERAAFGRPTSPEQARKAELALQALIGGGGAQRPAPIQIPDASRSTTRGVATSTVASSPANAATVIAPFAELSLLSEVEGPERLVEVPRPPRRPMSFWIAIAVGVSLLIGAALGWGVTAYLAAHPSNPSAVIKAGPGDVAAADHWFESKLATDPDFPEPFSLTSIGITPSHVRYVQYVSSGAVWVGKTTAGYCLLFTGIGGNGLDDQTTCASTKEFRRIGLTLYRHNEAFTWNGRLVNVIVAADGGSVK